MDFTGQYIVLLVVSIVLTFAVGQFLIRAGEPFLQEVFKDEKVSRSLNLLLSVLFHLVTLGVLAIISVIDIDTGNAVQTFVVKLGVVLLILGLAYGISMLVLLRVRSARSSERVSERLQERAFERAHPEIAQQETAQHETAHPGAVDQERARPRTVADKVAEKSV